MTSVNLIPAYRSGARKRRRRLRRWASACIGYAALLAAAYAFCNAVWGSDGRALAGEFDRADEKIAQANRRIGGLRQELLEHQRLLAANRLLSDQPDWSLLLAILGRTLREEVVLKSCELRPAWIAPGAGGATPVPAGSKGTGFLLGLRGFGRSQTLVAQFVLRLEQSELFKEVKLIKISRESFGPVEAVAFQLDCLLEAGGGKLR